LGVANANSADEPHKVGMLHSFAGCPSNMGGPSRDGLMLAVDEINKRGGVNGRQLKVIVDNDESDTAKGAPTVVKLITGEKVLAIVGPARSDITEALGPMAERDQVVDMTWSGILPTRGDYMCDYTFLTMPSPPRKPA
jgi:branched-chain amino acid transport system substrate-binding protein